MIGMIKGKLIEINNNLGLIETSGGVCYHIFLTPGFISKHTIDSLVSVRTFLQVREDNHTLYGFEDKKQYQLFKLLITVSGVGPKTAYNIVSFIKPDELIEAVKSNQVDSLTEVPGLGKKTAMKIILEISSKLKTDFDLTNMIISDDDKIVIDALVSLGYKSIEAKKLLTKIPKQLSLEDKI